MVRNKSSIVIKRQIPFAPKPIEDGQQGSVFLVDARPHEVDDCDVVPRLAPGAKSIAEHESERSFQHCFVRLLQAGFFIESQDFAGRGQFFIGACEEAIDLRPVGGVRFELFHPAQSRKRVYCARHLQERHLFDLGGT